MSHLATRPSVVLYAAALSLLAALIHLRVMPEHLEEWWGYGTFFLVCAVAQGLYAPSCCFGPFAGEADESFIVCVCSRSGARTRSQKPLMHFQ